MVLRDTCQNECRGLHFENEYQRFRLVIFYAHVTALYPISYVPSHARAIKPFAALRYNF